MKLHKEFVENEYLTFASPANIIKAVGTTFTNVLDTAWDGWLLTFTSPSAIVGGKFSFTSKPAGTYWFAITAPTGMGNQFSIYLTDSTELSNQLNIFASEQVPGDYVVKFTIDFSFDELHFYTYVDGTFTVSEPILQTDVIMGQLPVKSLPAEYTIDFRLDLENLSNNPPTFGEGNYVLLHENKTLFSWVGGNLQCRYNFYDELYNSETFDTDYNVVVLHMLIGGSEYVIGNFITNTLPAPNINVLITVYNFDGIGDNDKQLDTYFNGTLAHSVQFDSTLHGATNQPFYLDISSGTQFRFFKVHPESTVRSNYTVTPLDVLYPIISRPLYFPLPRLNVASTISTDYVYAYEPATHTLTTGTIPAGMTLSSSTGVISGTPTTQATYNFQLGVEDKYFRTSSVTSPTITVLPEFTGNTLLMHFDNTDGAAGLLDSSGKGAVSAINFENGLTTVSNSMPVFGATSLLRTGTGYGPAFIVGLQEAQDQQLHSLVDTRVPGSFEFRFRVSGTPANASTCTVAGLGSAGAMLTMTGLGTSNMSVSILSFAPISGDVIGTAPTTDTVTLTVAGNHHAYWSWDASGDHRLFLDGVLIRTVNLAGGYLGDYGNRISLLPFKSSTSFNFAIDELRSYRGTTIYTANFTPPASAY